MSWLDDVTADQLVTVVQTELKDRNMEGVEAALRLLAVKDPHRAEEVLTVIQLGIAAREQTDV